MSVNKVIYFKMEVDGIESSVRLVGDLKNELRDVKKAMKDADGDELANLEKKALGLQARLKDVEAEQRSVVRALQAAKTGEESYDRLNYSLGELRDSWRKMSKEERENVEVGGVVKKAINELDDELKRLDASIGNNQRNVGNYQQAFKGFSSAVPIVGEVGGIMEDLSMATGGVGKAVVIALALFKGFQEIAAYVGEVVARVDKLRGSIDMLSGEDGAKLDEITAKTSAMAQTWGGDSEEIVRAVNAVAKAYNMDYLTALKMVEDGYKAGANAGGDYLDMLKEYPTQFKAGGASADEFFAVISEGAKEGVFSDKMVDSVKEFGLRIREQTQPTKDALIGAFGTDFTNELLANVNSGKVSSMDALRAVSKEMNDTGLTAKQTQTVIADVFGGAGEDAGIDFILALKDVKGNMSDLIDVNDEYTIKASERLALNEEIARAEVELSNAYKDSVTDLSMMGGEVKKVGTELLTELAPAIDFVVLILKGLWEVIKFGIEIISVPFKLLKDGIIAVGEAIGLVDKSVDNMGDNINNKINVPKIEEKKKSKGVDVEQLKKDNKDLEDGKKKALEIEKKSNEERYKAESLARDKMKELLEKYKGIERELIKQGLDDTIEMMKEGREKELAIEQRRYKDRFDELNNKGREFEEKAREQAEKIALAFGSSSKRVMALRDKGMVEEAERRAIIEGKSSSEYLDFVRKSSETKAEIERQASVLIEQELEVHEKKIESIDKVWKEDRLKKLKEDLDKRYELFDRGLKSEELLNREKVAKMVIEEIKLRSGLDEESKNLRVFEFEVKLKNDSFDSDKKRLESELKELNEQFGLLLIGGAKEDELDKMLLKIKEVKAELLGLEAERTKAKEEESGKRNDIERKEAEKTLGYVGNILDMIGQISDVARDRDLDNVDKRKTAEEGRLSDLEKKLKTASVKEKVDIEKQIEFQKAKIKEVDNERADIERRAAERARFIKIAQLISTTALAVMAEYAKTGIGGAIAAGVMGAIQMGIMIAQPFAEGGMVKGDVMSGERVGSSLNFVDIKELSNGDNVLATLRKGEVVLNEEQQQRLGGDKVFKKLGIKGFSNGGRIGDSGVIPSGGRDVAGLYMLERSMENEGNKNGDIKMVLMDFKNGVFDMVQEINKRIDKIEVYMVVDDLEIELSDREKNVKEVSLKSR